MTARRSAAAVRHDRYRRLRDPTDAKNHIVTPKPGERPPLNDWVRIRVSGRVIMQGAKKNMDKPRKLHLDGLACALA